MNVPTADLGQQHSALEGEIMQALKRVIDTSAFCLGPSVEQFERAWADACEVEHAVGVQSGTAALMAALVAVGVTPGGEVVAPPATFVATVGAIHALGAVPRLVDIDEASMTLDPTQLADVLNPKTQAVVPVHLYGQCADMDAVIDICEARGIPVVEDASQAHLARYRGRSAGGLGRAGTFSFYPGKNLGALGDAGIVTTNDADVAARVRSYRSHGELRRYEHAEPGLNVRMSGFQGAVLAVKLPHLAGWNERRRQVAERYRVGLAGLPLELPRAFPERTHVYHQFVVRTPRRDALREHLAEHGVSTGLHYPQPVHLTSAYAFLGHQVGDFPHSERLSREAISMPIFPEITDEQVEFVVSRARAFFEEGGS